MEGSTSIDDRIYLINNINKLIFIRNMNTRHNIFGLWSLDLMEKLYKDLIKRERKVEVWADSVGVSVVNIDYKKPDPFFNINTKKDMDEAIKILKK